MSNYLTNEVIHSPHTILVVEDENIVALDLRSILTYLGYVVVGITGNGEEALSLMHSLKPDLVLMDIGLKGDKDGIETAETIRKEMSTPVVFITANADSATLNRAKITEPYGFILKPFDEREIQTTLEMVFFRFKSDQELRESRQWLATTLESIGDAVIATDEHGKIKFMNIIAENLTGWPQSEAIGKYLPEVFVIINESTRKPVANPVEIVLKEGRTVGLANHTVLIAKNGKEFNIDDSAAPIHSTKGETIGVVLTFRNITEKHKAEAMIEANERRFRALIENSSDMIRLIDTEGKVLYISPATERIIGFSLEEYVGQFIFDFIHPDDVLLAKHKLATILTHPETPINIQYRVKHKDGTWKWIEGISKNLLHDPAVGAIVSNIRDITERKKAEQDLQENHTFLKAVTEGTNDIIFVKDISGKYILCNTNGKKISGYTPEQMIGKTDAELFPAHVAEIAIEADRKVLETQANLTVENVIDISGEIHIFMVSKNPLYDNDGIMIGVIGVARDITELKKAQEELRQKEELFRALIEGSSDGVILIRDGKIIYSSPANPKILGYSPEERQEKSFDELLHPDDAPKIRGMYQEMVRGAEEAEHFEVRIHHKDGSWRMVEVNGRNMLSNPSVNAIVANFRDITDRKKVEQDLQENYSLLKSITEATDDVIFVKDTEDVYLFVNSSIEKTSGKTAQEIIGKTDDELFEKKEVALYKEVDNLVLGSEKGHTQEYTIMANGKLFNFMTSKNPLYDSNQKLKGIVGISRDITNLKKAQSDLVKSEELFRAMIEESNNGVVLINKEGEIQYSSPSNERIIGYSAEERYHQKYIDLIHPDYIEKIQTYFQRLIAGTGKNEPLVIQAKHKDGSWIWLEISCRNMFDNPSVNAIVCNFHDITRRTVAAEELHQSEEKHRLVVDSLQEGIIILNRNSEIVSGNESASRILGLTKDQLKGRTPFDPRWKSIHEDGSDYPPETRPSITTLHTGKKVSGAIIGFNNYEGNLTWVSVNSQPLCKPNETVPFAVALSLTDITERKKSEEKLRIYKRALENAGQGILITEAESIDNPIVFVNEEFCAMTGYESHEILGKNCRFLQGKDTDKIRVAEIRKSIKEHTNFEGEILNYKKDGTPFWNFLRITPVPNEFGEITHFIGFQNDITQQKQAEERLKKSEENYRILFENNPQPMWICDIESLRFIEVNNAMIKNYGYSREELLGMNLKDIRPLDDIPKLMNLIVKNKEDHTYKAELRHLKKNGEIIHVEITSHLIIYNNKPARHILANDITDRKKAEAELRKSEQNFHDIVEAITIPMVITNVKSRKILYCNQLVATMLGFSMDDLLKQNTLDFYANPEDRVKLAEEMGKKGFVQNVSIQLKRTNGELFWGLLTSYLIMFAGEEAVVTTVYDITEQKLAEEKIKVSEEKYRSLVKNSPDIIMTLDLDYIIKFVNYTIEGFTFEQVIGSNVFDYLLPQQHQEVKQVFENVRENKIKQHYEIEAPGPNGSVAWYFTYTIPIFSGEDVVGFTLITRDITNQKISEIELRKSELNFRNTVEAVTVPMIITTLKTSKVLYANKLVADMMEIPLEDITTLNAIEYYHNANEWDTYVKLLKEQGFVQNYLLQFKRRTGEILDVLVSSRIITYDGQQALVSTLNDITDQKKAEESVRMSEERLSGVIESAMDGIITIDSNHNIILFNKSAELMFLCTAEEAIGTTIERFIPNRFRQTHTHSITEFSKSGITNRTMGHLGEIKGLRTNGEEFPLEASISQISTIKGKLFTIILRDITQRQKNIQQIKEQAALLDIVPDAIIVRELDGKVIFWNTEAEKIYGWSSAEAVGKSIVDLINKIETTDYYTVQQVLLETDEWSGESYQYTKTGEKILVRSRRKLVRNAQGEPIMVLIINTDITEQRKIEEQFLRAQRLDSIGTLASGIAHDLNNILTPVVLQMELLKIKLDDAASKQRINEIIGIIRRGSGLISQVLGFARGTKEENVAINPKYIVSEISKVIRETFPRDIEIQVNISKEDMSIKGDGTQLHQILMNLCINARDAMPTGGKLSIELAPEKTDKNIIRQNGDAEIGLFAVITVSDNGSGIPPEIREKIFNPFFTTKEVGKGTGLGLATVYSIVKNHGGFVNVYSEVGNGTSFKIYLPAQVSVIDEIEEEVAIRQSGKKEVVLVVDDEELIRTITQDILEENGYVILTAQNGLEAAKIYQEKPDEISLVITDVMMPEMSGLDLIERIQTINPNARIIAASGMMQGDMAAKLLAIKISARLTKPFTADALLAAVQKALSK